MTDKRVNVDQYFIPVPRRAIFTPKNIIWTLKVETKDARKTSITNYSRIRSIAIPNISILHKNTSREKYERRRNPENDSSSFQNEPFINRGTEKRNTLITRNSSKKPFKANKRAKFKTLTPSGYKKFKSITMRFLHDNFTIVAKFCCCS